MAMSLDQLCTNWPELRIEGNRDVAVDAVCVDSRHCGPGTLFVAITGSQVDGHDYVPAAVAADCAAVCVAEDRRASLALSPTQKRPAAVVTVPDTAAWPARLARELVGRPDASMVVAGVTGTSGKTTVAFLMQSMLERLVGPCGLLGTVRYETGSTTRPAPLTTPDGPALYGLLAEMFRNGCRAVAMEVSSHALDQERTADLALDVAVMTNLGRDHLDYHHDCESYLAAKAKILTLLRPAAHRGKPAGAVALNGADPALAGLATGELATCRFAGGTGEPPADTAVDLQVVGSEMSWQQTRLVLAHAGTEFVLTSSLVGRFNAENLTAAVAAGLALGFPAHDCSRALSEVQQIPGRFERFLLPQGAVAVVDYAHSPDALTAVLTACRELTEGRLLLVFGCGGDRDQGKRPLMGAIAARQADRVWITSDNPRSEDPAAIASAIEAGFQTEPNPRAETYQVVLDRTAAIEHALADAGPEDLVIVAGKGHEDYQLVLDQRLDLDDRHIVREWAARRLNHA
jgi:UDP-N-acetylmuramoyl-L-alanyl-D-glutamate--2,6-diaminopimelate ligase